MKKILSKILTVVLVAVVAVYIGYQVSNLKDQVTTIEAVVMTAEETLPVRGVFVRSEQVISDPRSSGNRILTVNKNGSKVSAGAKMVIFFDDDQSYKAYVEMEKKEQELLSLQAAYKSLGTVRDYSRLDASLYRYLAKIGTMAKNGDAGELYSTYADLSQSVIIRTSDITHEAFEQLVAEINSEKDALSRMAGGNSAVYAEKGGYFVRNCDGYETVFDFKNIPSLTADMIKDSEGTGLAVSGDTVGVLVTEYYWYFAVPMTLDEYAHIKDLKTVALRFPGLGDITIDLSVFRVNSTDEKGTVAVIFKSGYITPELLSARYEDAEIRLSSVSGIRVPREALRNVEDEWGVYCLEGSKVIFKPVEILENFETYYLVKEAPDSKSGVYHGDRIVISGKKLEKGKIVN